MKPPIIAELRARASYHREHAMLWKDDGDPEQEVEHLKSAEPLERAANMIETFTAVRFYAFNCSCHGPNCDHEGVPLAVIDSALTEPAKAVTDAAEGALVAPPVATHAPHHGPGERCAVCKDCNFAISTLAERADAAEARADAEAKEMVPDEDGVLHTKHEKFLFDQMEAWRLECIRERARADAAEARLRDAELLIKKPAFFTGKKPR